MNLSDAERLFHEALTQASPAERASFLDGACGGDSALRERVQRLLDAHEQTVSLLPEDPLRAGPALRPAEDAGSVIGRYKLLQQIGEGGMGVVYMAEQEEPVRRRVALKIIKRGMDTRAVIARFEAERQALAMMDHPNIARVLDGGATETGRPYFVMELVQGVPITEYCDKNRLPAADRLKLFVAVCQAIQSAHQKGIIHRDIKPSNVLVTLEHGEPMPKVIDFGIAKATNQKLTEKTLFTNYATMVGTPAYMSPEQAEMTSLDIDTRADIYSLGVLLYELLTGTTPFQAERLRSLGYGEMQRVIVEEEPERPSTRLGTLTAEQKTAVARNRRNDVQALGALLRGDLDWVVMRCLEKDRRRRYETANALAADLQRHLANEPVTARPPAASYRFQKWVRRNRTVALSIAAVALALIAAAVVSTGAFLRERQARLETVAGERAREEARRASRVESVRADTVATFATGLIDRVAPELFRKGHPESIRHLLSIADELASDLSNAPLAQARIRFNIGREFAWHLEEHQEAIRRLRAVEPLDPESGLEGARLRNHARLLRVGSELWDRLDPATAEELVRLGQEAATGSPPDYDAAAFGFAAAAEFLMENPDQRTRAERLAREAAAFPVESLDGVRFQLKALHYLVIIAEHRRDVASASKATERFFGLLHPLWTHSDPTTRGKAIEFLNDIWIADWTVFPAAELRSALSRFPPQPAEARATLLGLLGVATARQGHWHEGLALVREAGSAMNGSGALRIWDVELGLARLLGDSEAVRALWISGLARFANGADPLNCMVLARVLPAWSDPAFRPAISNLVTRSQAVSGYLRTYADMTLALSHHYTGRSGEAAVLIERLLNEMVHRPVKGSDERHALVVFMNACVQARLRNMDSARAAYQRGLTLHSTAFRAQGIPYEGVGWTTAFLAEVMKRESEALLGIKVVNP